MTGDIFLSEIRFRLSIVTDVGIKPIMSEREVREGKEGGTKTSKEQCESSSSLSFTSRFSTLVKFLPSAACPWTDIIPICL